MKKLEELTARELEHAKDQADALCSKLVNEMIQAGRGHETIRDTVKKTDDLSVRCKLAHNHYQTILGESRYRKEYHGSLNKIKRPKGYHTNTPKPVQDTLL